MEGFAELGRGEEAQFSLAGRAQAGADVVEIGVVIAGMSDELPSAVREVVEDLVKERFIKNAGGRNSETAIGREHALICNEAAEFAGEGVEQHELAITLPELRT